MIHTDELVSEPKTKIETQDTQDFKDEEHYEFEYADIDLSEEFLSRILKQVDELCDAIQVNLCQKHLFFDQLTHNMTMDCSLIYQFST